MDFSAIKKVLKEQYLTRDVVAIVQLVTKLKSSPEFPQLYRSLLTQGLISGASAGLEQVASALIGKIKHEIADSNELEIHATYFDVETQLKKKFGQEISDSYIQDKVPDDFMIMIREQKDHGDASRLSDQLVKQYKEKLISIETSRRKIVAILQPFAAIQIQTLVSFDQSFEQLTRKLKSNYKYLSVKPYLETVRTVATNDNTPLDDEETDGHASALFSHYVITGVEPDLDKLVSFQFAIAKLFQLIKKDGLLEQAEYNQYWATASKLWQVPDATGLSPKAYKIFADLLVSLDQDKQLLKLNLATTFIEEYQCAEEQMKIRHRLIETELSNTKEYLERVQTGDKAPAEDKEEKVRVAVEKVICLNEVFKTSIRLEEASASRTDMELEQSALDIPTVITPFQLTDWIKIYSIIYSNSAFLEHSDDDIDLSIMRSFISDLTTYHLIQNIAQLKYIIESSPIQDEEKNSQFERFSDALKVRLHSLMDNVKQKERSLKSMIDELAFLNNKSSQFVVADTFKGFQYIVDAFNATSSDFFVNDKEAMLKESRALYNQICNQCLKGFGNRPSLKKRALDSLSKPKEKRSWLGRLFS